MRRKLVLGALALALPFASLVTMGAGSATAHANITGTGLVSCTKLTGTVTFKPPLKNATQTIVTTTKSTGTGCTSTGTKVTSFTSSSTGKPTATNCGNQTKPTAATFKIVYVPSTVAGSTFTGTATGGASSKGFAQFTLSGKVTGSFPSAKATALAVTSTTLSAFVTACGKAGVSSLTITSGNTKNG